MAWRTSGRSGAPRRKRGRSMRGLPWSQERLQKPFRTRCDRFVTWIPCMRPLACFFVSCFKPSVTHTHLSLPHPPRMYTLRGGGGQDQATTKSVTLIGRGLETMCFQTKWKSTSEAASASSNNKHQKNIRHTCYVRNGNYIIPSAPKRGAPTSSHLVVGVNLPHSSEMK